jgi:hypothetical protein
MVDTFWIREGLGTATIPVRTGMVAVPKSTPFEVIATFSGAEGIVRKRMDAVLLGREVLYPEVTAAGKTVEVVGWRK